MAEPLAPASPLPAAAFLPDLAAVSGVRLRPAADMQIASLAAFSGRAAAVSALVQEVWGLVLPTTPRRVAADGIAFVWAGPDRWLVTAPATTDLEGSLRDRLGGLAAVTDQGGGRTVLRIGGAGTREVLAKLIGIDLHPRRFRTGDAALTLAGHVPVHFWQLDDMPTYEIAMPRSLAGSLYEALQEAA